MERANPAIFEFIMRSIPFPKRYYYAEPRDKITLVSGAAGFGVVPGPLTLTNCKLLASALEKNADVHSTLGSDMISKKRHISVPGFLILFVAIMCVPAAAVDETWTEVRSPNFIVVSNASVKEAQNVARSFEQFRLLIRKSIPGLSADPGSPLTILAVKGEREFLTLLGVEKLARGEVKRSGWFISGPERKFVAIRLDVPEERRYQTIYHEYTHLLVNLNFGSIPVWLNEGLAEFYGNTTVGNGESKVGEPGVVALDVLRKKPLIPLKVLFSVKHDSPYYRDEDKASVFYPESWALTHYLMIGDKRKHAHKLDEYMKLIRQGVPDKEAAEQALGNLDELEKALRIYIQSPAFYSYSIQTKLDIGEDKYAARQLSTVESLAVRGELLVYFNKPDKARGMLEQSLKTDPDNARANEAMGQLYQRLGNRQQAGAFFSKAAELDSNSYMAQFYSAQAKLQEDGDLELAVKQLSRAIILNPGFAQAYSRLAFALRRQDRLPEALAISQQAELIEPGVIVHGINTAYILLDMRKTDEALAKAQNVLTKARTEADLKLAENLMNQVRNIRNMEQRREEMTSQIESNNQQIRRDRERIQEENNRKEEEKYQAFVESENKRKAEVERRANLKTEAPIKLSGLIRSVKCDYPAAMTLIFESKGKQYRLYAENYYNVQYMAVGDWPDDEEIYPCRDLEGNNAEIELLRVVDTEIDGFIETIYSIK